MSTLMRVSLLTLSIAGLAWLAPCQESTEVERDPELPAKLKQFKSATQDRDKARDAEATTIVDQWLQAYKSGMHPKDAVSVLKAIKDCLESSRVKRDPEHKGLFVAASVALGHMGADGAKVLASAYKSTKFKGREWIEMRAVFLTNLGKTKSEGHVKLLTDAALKDPDDAIMRAAGAALGNFDEASQKLRKEIVKDMQRKFNEVYNKAKRNLDPGDAQVKRSKERFDAIRDDWNKTLRQLTKQSYNSPGEWLTFWNKNKNKDWDKL